jgi:hypothetical protein
MRIGNLWNGRCIKGKHEEKWFFVENIPQEESE